MTPQSGVLMESKELFALKHCPCGQCDDGWLRLVACADCGMVYGQCEESEMLSGHAANPGPHPMLTADEDCLSCEAPLSEVKPASNEQALESGLRFRVDYQ